MNGANLLLPPTYLHGVYSDNFSLFASFTYTQKLYQFEFVAGQLFPTLKQNPGDHKLKIHGKVQTVVTRWLITLERDHVNGKRESSSHKA